jgi:hypothetical protein
LEGSTEMHLHNRALYRIDDAITSLYRGLELIADRTLNGYALYTPEEWDTPRSDPHFVIDARGRILRNGCWTGYTVEELVPCSDTGGDPAPGHWPLDRFVRPRRHDRGGPRFVLL